MFVHKLCHTFCFIKSAMTIRCVWVLVLCVWLQCSGFPHKIVIFCKHHIPMTMRFNAQTIHLTLDDTNVIVNSINDNKSIAQSDKTSCRQCLGFQYFDVIEIWLSSTCSSKVRFLFSLFSAIASFFSGWVWVRCMFASTPTARQQMSGT